MDTTITLRRNKHPSGCYDTEFSYQDYDNTFTLSDGDYTNEQKEYFDEIKNEDVK